MFASVEAVQEQFRASRYIASRRIATVVYLASRMNRPILVEGPAGVGKTELAKVLAETTGRPLVRLQCYEGLDEAKALYEWEYAKQLLYTQMLKDKIGELIADAPTLPEAVDRIAGRRTPSSRYRFLCRARSSGAILADEPVVLLVDEIDKADPEFEAFLLEVLSDWQVTVPELGTLKARHVPARRADLQQRARAVRRAQAPLPAPVHRLPGRRRGAGDPPAQGAEASEQLAGRS